MRVSVAMTHFVTSTARCGPLSANGHRWRMMTWDWMKHSSTAPRLPGYSPAPSGVKQLLGLSISQESALITGCTERVHPDFSCSRRGRIWHGKKHLSSHISVQPGGCAPQLLSDAHDHTTTLNALSPPVLSAALSIYHQI